jgi:excisionase family DNA binding protein
MDERYLTVDEVADYLQMRRETLYRWLKAGRLPGHKVGRGWRCTKEEIDEWVRSGGAAEEQDKEA